MFEEEEQRKSILKRDQLGDVEMRAKSRTNKSDSSFRKNAATTMSPNRRENYAFSGRQYDEVSTNIDPEIRVRAFKPTASNEYGTADQANIRKYPSSMHPTGGKYDYF